MNELYDLATGWLSRVGSHEHTKFFLTLILIFWVIVIVGAHYLKRK